MNTANSFHNYYWLKSFLGVLIPPIKKNILTNQRYIWVLSIGVGKIPLGLSRKNEPNSIINNFDAIRHFRIEWNYTLTFYNNFEYAAYNIKFTSPWSQATMEPKINSLVPLVPNSNAQYSVTFIRNLECKAQESVKLMNDIPAVLKNPLTIEYTNVKGTKFYTTFKFQDGKTTENIFSRTLTT